MAATLLACGALFPVQRLEVLVLPQHKLTTGRILLMEELVWE